MSRIGLTCCLAVILALRCDGAGVAAKAKAKAKMKDPWDVPEGGGEEMEAAPGGEMDSEMSPEDQANVFQEVARRSAIRRAHNQHEVMKQFMSSFANNMRLSVLADSKGDMPEDQRQRLIAKAMAEKERAQGGGPIVGGDDGPPPQQAEEEEEEAPPPPPPRRRLSHLSHRSQMINMAAARQRQQRMQHARHKLLPEAEGIGFPAPEGMASDPATDGMVNDPGMTSVGDSPAEYEAPPPRRPLRHHAVRMLNQRGGVHHRHQSDAAAHRHHHDHQLPPGVVRDEMGRAMPLLSFGGPKPEDQSQGWFSKLEHRFVHSGTSGLACPLALTLLLTCLMTW